MGLRISREHKPGLGGWDSDFQTLRSSSRKPGVTQKQFQEFIRAADAGLRVEMHGQNYVAMSRNMYDELKRAANPIKVTVDESEVLRKDVMNEIHRMWAGTDEAKS